MIDKRASGGRDYAIGYGRPPKAAQFASGKSGNPRGRPKGSRSVAASLQEALSGKVTLTENGKSRRVSRLDAMLQRLTSDALRGEKPALKLLLSLLEKHSEAPESRIDLGALLGEDAAILAEALCAGLRPGLEARDDPEPAQDSESEEDEEGGNVDLT